MVKDSGLNSDDEIICESEALCESSQRKILRYFSIISCDISKVSDGCIYLITGPPLQFCSIYN